ncbi:MAG: hypothetical protein WAM24_03010 [Ignavibacteriaceae bacterium]
MINNSPNSASEFVNEVEKFSGLNLNKKAELLRIYEEAINSGKEKIFEDLAFTGKYLRGLMRVLQNGSSNPQVDSMDKIKADFSANIKKIIEQIKGIISSADESLRKHFEEKYFEMSQEGLTNLNELLSDLEWTKIYLNDQKRQKPN